MTYKKRVFNLLQFSKYLLPYWDKQAVLYLGMTFSLLLGLAQPYLTRLIIDYALLGRDLQIFNLLLVVGVISLVFSIPVEFLHKYTSFFLRTRVSFDLRSFYYRHLQRLSIRFVRKRSVGEQLYRLGPDLENVVALVVDTIPSALVFIVRFGALLAICLWMDVTLTMVVLLTSPFIIFHTRFFTLRQYPLTVKTTETSQNVSSRLQESLTNMNLIKIFGCERSAVNRYIRDVISLIRLNVKNVRLNLYQGESSRLLNAVITGGITYYLGYLIIRGRMTFGQLTALTMYLFQLLSAIKGVGDLYRDVVMKCIAMDRVSETLDAEVEVADAPDALATWKSSGMICFQDVTFGYEPGDSVFRQISFRVKPGQFVALIGPSGVGKTTISLLLLRLYDPCQGTILLDGHDIRSLKLSALKRSIGFASHDPQLLGQSISENIRFGQFNLPLGKVIKAAKLAEAHEFICTLPKGYDTVLGEGGQPLSQGQQQRIAIARGLLRNPQVMIMDEAMSSLDTWHEQQIIKNLRSARPEMTLLVISHRRSAVENADSFILLRDGIISVDHSFERLWPAENYSDRGLNSKVSSGGQVINAAIV